MSTGRHLVPFSLVNIASQGRSRSFEDCGSTGCGDVTGPAGSGGDVVGPAGSSGVSGGCGDVTGPTGSNGVSGGCGDVVGPAGSGNRLGGDVGIAGLDGVSGGFGDAISVASSIPRVVGGACCFTGACATRWSAGSTGNAARPAPSPLGLSLMVRSLPSAGRLTS